ncbi:MAG: DUF59 domain-containing protein, partial [Rubrivivax sp.]
MVNLASARERLAAVPDPEIPAVTLVDLGIVRDLRETASGVEVVLTPTYSGCMALSRGSVSVASCISVAQRPRHAGSTSFQAGPT